MISFVVVGLFIIIIFCSFYVTMLGLLGHQGRRCGVLCVDEQANEESPNCILPQGEFFYFSGI